MCKIVSLLDMNCSLFLTILQTFVESCVVQIAKICNISIQRCRSGNCFINVCFFVISFIVTELIDKNCSLMSITNVGPICNMLFSVCSNTGTDLCRGGSKRYFSCNIQVGDGLLNNSFYTHKQTCSVPLNVTVIKLDAFCRQAPLRHGLYGSFLWDFLIFLMSLHSRKQNSGRLSRCHFSMGRLQNIMGLCEIIWNTNLMQQGNFINVFLARHASGNYAHHQEH